MQSDQTTDAGARSAGAQHHEAVSATDEHAVDTAHVHLSPQSNWPITMAAGITLMGAGLVTTVSVSIFGFVLFVLSLVFWIQELRHEHH